MKSILFLFCFTALVSCKSNESNKSSAEKLEETTELVPAKKVEVPSEQSKEVSEQLTVGEPLIVESQNIASIYGNWRIISIKESGKIIDLPYEEWDMQLTFEEESENVGIKSPCNSGGCDYKLTGSNISIGSNCFFTEMYCEEEQKNIWERKLVSVLANQTEISELTEISLKLNGTTFNVELSRI